MGVISLSETSMPEPCGIGVTVTGATQPSPLVTLFYSVGHQDGFKTLPLS
jgi:hypothetical protein